MFEIVNERTMTEAVAWVHYKLKMYDIIATLLVLISYQRTNGPVNAHLISWPTKHIYIVKK